MEHLKTDVLVIGGGTAGCFAAIRAKSEGLDVTIVDKAGAGYSGASIMASGFWAVFNADWGMDYDEYLRVIYKDGAYLNNRVWTEMLLRDSWQTYLDLKEWGVPFPMPEEAMSGFFRSMAEIFEKNGEPPRMLCPIPLRHRAVTPVLREHAQRVGCRVIDRVMMTDLIVRDGAVLGAVGFGLETGEPLAIQAKATVMTAGRNYFKPPGMNVSGQTGDAGAMAYRAGATLSGGEFQDMHMNVAMHPMWKGNGEAYPAYFKYDDALGRTLPNLGFDLAMVSAIHAGHGPILWDFGKATEADLKNIDDYIEKRGNPKEMQRVGLDPHEGKRIPMVGGAAAGGNLEHTAGIWPVDDTGAASLAGLFAAGGACATWAYGANVLSSPGLSTAGVTGKRAGGAAAAFAKDQDFAALSEAELSESAARVTGFMERKSGYEPRWVFQLLQNYMLPWYVLYIKRANRLTATLELVGFLRDHMVPMMTAGNPHELRIAHETANMTVHAEMILRASLMREESRGLHFREDFPAEDDKWLAWIQMRQGEYGKMALRAEPVPEEWRRPAGEPYAPRWLAWEHPHTEEA